MAVSKFGISFCSRCLKWTLEKAVLFLFFIFEFFPWFEAFTIHKRQTKLKIHNSRPKISLETKFQSIIFKTIDGIFFYRTTLFSESENFNWPFLNSHFQNFEIWISWVGPDLSSEFQNSRFKSAIVGAKIPTFTHPVDCCCVQLS